MSPFDIDNVTIEFPDWSSALLNPPPAPMISITQHPTINTGVEPQQTEPFLTSIGVAVTLAVILVVVAGLLVYHKKHKAKSG